MTGVAAGVIFDFHNTLVRAESLSRWLLRAVEDANHRDAPVNEIVPVLREVWSRASVRYPDGAWDLDPSLHRQVFEEVLVEESPCPAAVASALYDLMPGCWAAVDGVIPLLESLVLRGIPLAIVSNIGLDIRPRLEELGMLQFFDTIVLSCEVRLAKPDPRIFERAVTGLGLSPTECIMIGDSPVSDGGAVTAGICSVLVPVVDDRPQLSRVTALLANI